MMPDSLDFTLDDLAELNPDPTPTHRTRGHQPNACKTATSVKIRQQARQESGPDMLRAALWYARRGWYVFPVHVPLFDADGHCIGCTCEAWKRTQAKYGPNYKCPQPGKCPAVRWADKATIDPEQIEKWWGHQWKTTDATGKTIYYTPNIGISCGPSGLLVLDADAYKDSYAGDALLSFPDEQTVTSLTGNLGAHLIYDRQGKPYGNATGDLPEGIDIRGVGGYIVAPPSLHKSGRRYQFEEGYNPTQIELKPIPASLITILDAAHETKAARVAVAFTADTTEPPNLLRWHISPEVREMIKTVPAGDRSKPDIKVVTSLVYAGAGDDEIRAIFQHNEIGQGKYAVRGDEYLAMTIGSARAWVADHPRPDMRATLAGLRLSIKTKNLVDHIGPGPGSKKLRLVADGVFDLMEEDDSPKVTTGKKRLGAISGVSCNTAANALALLNGVLFNVTHTEWGYTIELLEEHRLQLFDPSLKIITKNTDKGSTVSTGDQKTANDKNAYSPHKADEPFLTGTSRYMREHIQRLAQALEIEPVRAKADYTFPSLGEGVLLAFDTWQRIGDFTAQEYAKETGIKLSSARVHLRRAETMGLAEAEREGSRGPKVYSFIPEFWQRVDELAPDLRTYKITSRREDKRLESAQQWCKKNIEQAKEEIKAAQIAYDTEAEQAARDKKKALDQRFERLGTKRKPHLQRLHPDLSPKAVERLAYEVDAYKRRGAAPSPEVRKARNDQADEHRSTVRIIRELADSFSDIDTPQEQVYKAIMQFGTFDEKLVKAVLQSPKQMQNYETLPDVRKRLAHADLMSDLRMTPPTSGHEQPALLGGAA